MAAAQVRVFAQAGAPISGSGGTLAGAAEVGDLLVDLSARTLYVCTATEPASGTGAANSPGVPATITWSALA